MEQVLPGLESVAAEVAASATTKGHREASKGTIAPSAHQEVHEALARWGNDAALPVWELLAAAAGVPEDTARSLLAGANGSLTAVYNRHVAELATVAGLNRRSATRILAALGLARRMAQEILPDRQRIQGPVDVADLLREEFRGKDKEEFHVLLLDTRNGLVHHERLTIGLVERCLMHARELFRRAISVSCVRVILAHNHPAGDPSPSAQDIEATRSLAAAGKIVGIEVVDHIVVGQRTATRTRDWLSFREANLM